MSNIKKAIDYGLSLEGTPYGYCYEDKCQKGNPMFAVNGNTVPKPLIKTICSSGLINLILRYLGKELPKDDKGNISGIKSYFYHFRNLSEEFNIDNTYPPGTLIMREFTHSIDQGHLAIILEEKGRNSRLLQSFHKKCLKSSGVCSKYTIVDSHYCNPEGYYQRAVLPQNWLC
jgi:hypothetical protein